MNNEQQLNNLAEDVREQGLSQAASMKDLVFDPVTGDFRQVPHGSQAGEGDIVTEMTNKGFAAEGIPDEVVYMREDDLKKVVGMLPDKKRVRIPAEEIEKGVYHVWPEGTSIHDRPGREVGCFLSEEDRLPTIPFGEDWKGICILHSGESPRAFVSVVGEDARQTWKEVPLSLIPSEENLFSRSKGILEVGVLRGKRVMIVGRGSFGSQIAIELAKAGVGSFALMDFDRVELHNLSRHTATVHDLGRLKTNVIEEAILGKNPYAKVDKFPVNINDDLPLLYEEVGKADLVICATDNNTSRFSSRRARSVSSATPLPELRAAMCSVTVRVAPATAASWAKGTSSRRRSPTWHQPDGTEGSPPMYLLRMPRRWFRSASRPTSSPSAT